MTLHPTASPRIAGGGRALVGREQELDHIQLALDAGASAAGTALILRGAGGVGLSALLDAACRIAADSGFLILHWARRTSGSRPSPVVAELVRPLLEFAGDLSTAQRTALSDLVRPASVTSARRIDDTRVSLLLCAAVADLVRNAASRRPVLIAVDDLAAVDAPSQRVLAFLARRTHFCPLVLVLSAAESYVGPLHDCRLPEIDVTALDPDSARLLVRRIAPTIPSAAEQLLIALAAGSPAALVEMATAMATSTHERASQSPELLPPLPERLVDRFAGTLDGLTEPCRDLLLLAALSSTGSFAEVRSGAERLAGTPVGMTVADEAMSAGLLDIDGDRLTFRHPLMRPAIVRRAPTVRRRAAHAALAAVLETEHERRAWHLGRAVDGLDDDADVALGVAARALVPDLVPTVQATRPAVGASSLALDRVLRGRRLIAAAEQALEMGRPDLVARLVGSAVRTPLSHRDRERAAWLRHAGTTMVTLTASRAQDLCDAAEDAVDAGDDSLALDLLLAAAWSCWATGADSSMRSRIADAVDLSPGSANEPLRLATVAMAEPIRRSAQVLREVRTRAAQPGLDTGALRLLGVAAHAVGDEIRAAELLQHASDALRRDRRSGLLLHTLVLRGCALLELGLWTQADAVVAEGRRVSEECGQPGWTAACDAVEARLRAGRGDVDAALALSDMAVREAAATGLLTVQVCAHLARSQALISGDRYAEALDLLVDLYTAHVGDDGPVRRELYAGLADLAEAATLTGRQGQARQLVAGMRTLGSGPAAPPLLAVQLAVAQAMLADEDNAEDLFRAGLRGDLVRWTGPRARLQLAFGSWLRSRNRAVEARPMLRAARRAFDEMGATSGAKRARLELRAAGEPDSTDRLETWSEMSEQELRVVRLAAAGLTNREIGERLFLSPRTVGSTLYRLFPRLGVTSRGQLTSHVASLKHMAGEQG